MAVNFNSSNSTEPHSREDSTTSDTRTGSTDLNDGQPRFTSFPKLAPELRDKIWKEVCFEPRNIDIWVRGLAATDIQHDDDDDDEMAYNTRTFLNDLDQCSYDSHSTTPSILLACKESRVVGLKHYSLEFGSRFDMSFGNVTINVSTPARIFVNWDCDVICPMNLRDRNYMLEDLTRRATGMKHLALPIDDSTFYAHFLKRFDLEQVILYARHLYYVAEGSKFDAEKSLAIKFSSVKRSPGYTQGYSQADELMARRDFIMGYNGAYLKSLLSEVGKYPDITRAVMENEDI
jgi:2EXR family